MSQNYFFPPAGGASSNPSIGTNGITAPTSSTEVGGINPSGNLAPIQIDASGNLKVALTSSTAEQDVNLNQVGGAAITLGQKLMASSLPVVLASDQSVIPVSQSGTWNINNVSGTISLPTGAATSALQTTISGQLPTTLGQTLSASSLAVVIASDQSTIPVSTASLPLPSGAATSALQTTGNASLSSIDTKVSTSALQTTGNASLSSIDSKTPALGAAVIASSVPVNIASDQIVSIIDNDFTASGTITTQNLVPTGSATAGSAVSISANNKGTVTIQVTGTYTGVLSPQVTTDGTTWVTAGGLNLANMGTGANSATIPSGANGIYQIEVNGHAEFRITALAAVTGTATITLRAAQGTSQITVAALPLPTGAATAANQTTQTTQLNAINANTDNLPTALGQTTMSASLPVVLASDQSSLPTTVGGKSVSNAPVYNIYSSSPVTTGAYVQLVASTTSTTNMIEIFDSSGQSMIIGVGGAGSEVVQLYTLPGGNGQVPLLIPAGSRVAIKALTASATSGYLTINFYS